MIKVEDAKEVEAFGIQQPKSLKTGPIITVLPLNKLNEDASNNSVSAPSPTIGGSISNNDKSIKEIDGDKSPVCKTEHSHDEQTSVSKVSKKKPKPTTSTKKIIE